MKTRTMLCAAAALVSGCGDEAAFGGGGRAASVAEPAGTLHAWRAEPAMIANLGVYRDNEFVYQDFIYDDHGANTDGLDRFDAPLGTPGPDPDDPVNPRMSPAPLINWAGDFTYAAPDGTHMANVADLIEFRVAADADSVLYRLRMGDMTAPDSAVVALCVDEDGNPGTGLAAWPFGAGLDAQLGCEHFYTVYGSGAQVTDAAGQSQDLASLGGAVAADLGEALIELRVPRSVANPGAGRWRYYVASGVWDPAGMTWARPLPLPAQAGLPVTSGGGLLVPAIWDLLSNNGEPNGTWNEEKQANDLSAHQIVDDYLDVNFARLAEKANDPDPQLTGVVPRIYRSQHPTAVGRGIDKGSVGKLYLGPWQPYTAVIPASYYAHPDKAYAFDFCMHPLGTNHNVEVFYAEAFARRDYNPVVTGVTPSSGYLGFSQITSLVDRLDAVYACVLGRGEGEGYQGGIGLVDALEVQEDMARRYRVDDEHRTVHGVSLGALGTWYVARLYPDRYSAAMPYIFSPDIAGGITETPTLKNLYNLPVFFSIGTLDQFGQGTQGDLLADQLEGFGDEYVYLHYLLRQHEGRIENDFVPFTSALAYPRTRVRDPARVRYVLEPALFAEARPATGSAYWVSGMSLRDVAIGSAEIDVTSLARANQLPKHQVIIDGLYLNLADTYVARIRGLLRVTEEEFAALWQPAVWQPGWQALQLTVTPSELPVEPIANGFRLTAVNLGSVTLDPERMGLAPGAPVQYSVKSDGPLEIGLGNGRHLSVPAGQSDGVF
ncbi:MAG TPA: hypothetical protein VM074_04940 [Solimonas sp.]|nr:hypothetical protein [Solimonas sp.]